MTFGADSSEGVRGELKTCQSSVEFCDDFAKLKSSTGKFAVAKNIALIAKLPIRLCLKAFVTHSECTVGPFPF